MTELELVQLSRQFTLEIELWDRVAKAGERVIRAAARELGLLVRTYSRPKDGGSLLAKATKDADAPIRPLSELSDLAGARGVVLFRKDVERLVDEITSSHSLQDDQIDWKHPDVAELAYQGCHIDFRFGDGDTDLLQGHVLEPERQLVCELQIRTAAQDMWSNLSHEVAYKKNVADGVRRRINRLVALAEIIDDEAEQAAAASRTVADFEFELQRTADRLFRSLGNQSDAGPYRESELLTVLAASIGDTERPTYSGDLAKFVLHDKLEQVVSILTSDLLLSEMPVVALPEVLVVLERLWNAPALLRRNWPFIENDLNRLEVLINT